MKLTDREWKEFKVKDLFSISIARSNDKGNLVEGGDIPFIGRSTEYNGFQGYYQGDKITDGRCITVGMVGTYKRAYWQPFNQFYASQNLMCIRSKRLNEFRANFICAIINKTLEQTNYANSIKIGTFGDVILKLPVDITGQPDYDFMEQYMKTLPFSKVLEQV